MCTDAENAFRGLVYGGAIQNCLNLSRSGRNINEKQQNATNKWQEKRKINAVIKPSWNRFQTKVRQPYWQEAFPFITTYLMFIYFILIYFFFLPFHSLLSFHDSTHFLFLYFFSLLSFCVYCSLIYSSFPFPITFSFSPLLSLHTVLFTLVLLFSLSFFTLSF